jgi:hypothetical protein
MMEEEEEMTNPICFNLFLVSSDSIKRERLKERGKKERKREREKEGELTLECKIGQLLV